MAKKYKSILTENYTFPFEVGMKFKALVDAPVDMYEVKRGDVLSIVNISHNSAVASTESGSFLSVHLQSKGDDPAQLEYVPRNGDVFQNDIGNIWMYTMDYGRVIYLTGSSDGNKPYADLSVLSNGYNCSNLVGDGKMCEQRYLFNINNLTTKLVDKLEVK